MLNGQQETEQTQQTQQNLQTNQQDNFHGDPQDDLQTQDNEQNNSENNAQNQEPEVYGSPETYDYSEVQLPENMQLDNELISEFNPVAKKLNLSQKSANELVELAVKLTGKNMQKTSDALEEMQHAKSVSYEQMLLQDEEFSKMDDENYNQYLNTANLGISKVATKGFQELIKKEGLTKHPDFIKTFHQIGKLCQSDSIPNANYPVGKSERMADILFDKTGKNVQ